MLELRVDRAGFPVSGLGQRGARSLLETRIRFVGASVLLLLQGSVRLRTMVLRIVR